MFSTGFSLLAIDPSQSSLTPHPWAWKPHPEVWIMIAALVLMYFYVTRVIGPKAVPKGQPIITRSQSRWYFSAIFLLWVAADWPMHDIAEDYLYSVHMVQHLTLTLVIPPMILIATPEWLARLVLGRGRTYRIFRFATLPLVAGVLYNVIFAFAHIPWVVDDSVRSAGFHFGMHLALVLAALLMWNCVCGPLKELRISLPAQCIYLFLMSILPTVPGAWLVFANGVVYKEYIHPWPKLWGLTPIMDQQLAGFIMKVIGGLYLWSIIVKLFFNWSRHQQDADDKRKVAKREARLAMAGTASVDVAGQAVTDDLDGGVLTFDQVQEAFERSTPAMPTKPEPPAKR